MDRVYRLHLRCHPDLTLAAFEDACEHRKSILTWHEHEAAGTHLDRDEIDQGPLLGISPDTKRLAHEILRSMKYCYDKSQHFMGTFTCVFIFDVAYSCLDEDSREVTWLRATTLSQRSSVQGGLSTKGLAIKVLHSCQVK